ncbi:MAG: sigma-70 family RNA polymerase sigma factor [Brasilonema octagenarum HA4186-MV1]|jgi:DNA-directed RNA polymerase specialized sigma24 family protein|nr:sigma-70 family RNA polymerase sigma factor [Brasilonema octagenarum HA4186-MV1]
MTKDELDSYLLQLACVAQRHPPHSQERQIALTKLIHSIVRFGNLWYPSKSQFFSNVQDIYNEARQELFLYICQNIDKYDPERGTVLVWVNVLLERRFFKDTLRKNLSHSSVTKMTLTDLDNLALPEESKDLTEIVKECIESDPEDIFKNEYMEQCPQATFQALAMLRMSGKSWKEISAEFEMKVPTVSSFYYRCLKKLSPKLKEYCENQVD